MQLEINWQVLLIGLSGGIGFQLLPFHILLKHPQKQVLLVG
jgi:hypothetical protein